MPSQPGPTELKDKSMISKHNMIQWKEIKGDTEMSFEIYHPRAKAKAKPIIVRVSKTAIVLNKIARVQLDSPEYVELAFDQDTNTMRIRPSTIAGGSAVKKTKVMAPGFFKQFGISATGAFYAEHDDAENALYVKLG
jgi:hypothetical protein